MKYVPAFLLAIGTAFWLALVPAYYLLPVHNPTVVHVIAWSAGILYFGAVATEALQR